MAVSYDFFKLPIEYVLLQSEAWLQIFGLDTELPKWEIFLINLNLQMSLQLLFCMRMSRFLDLKLPGADTHGKYYVLTRNLDFLFYEVIYYKLAKYRNRLLVKT